MDVSDQSDGMQLLGEQRVSAEDGTQDDSIDRMRDDGGLATEIPHRPPVNQVNARNKPTIRRH